MYSPQCHSLPLQYTCIWKTLVTNHCTCGQHQSECRTSTFFVQQWVALKTAKPSKSLGYHAKSTTLYRYCNDIAIRTEEALSES